MRKMTNLGKHQRQTLLVGTGELSDQLKARAQQERVQTRCCSHPCPCMQGAQECYDCSW